MEPEEFATVVKKLWLGFCDHLYAFATVIVHWLIVLGDVGAKGVSAFYAVAGTFTRRGWRVILPWIFIYASAGLAYRAANGLPMPDVAAILGVMVPLASSTVVAQITRSIEVRAGVGGGGNIMDTIGGMFNSFAPGASVDGSPRPVAPA